MLLFSICLGGDVIALPWPATPGVYELPIQTFDRRKLDNYPLYLAESKGALGILLGDSEHDLRLRHGAPDFRDYAAPEILHYNWTYYQGEIKMRNGRVIAIKIKFNPDIKRSTPWLTALGLHEEDLLPLSKQEKIAAIQRHYATRHQIVLKDRLEIFGRGITFYFTQEDISAIEIYTARSYP